MFLESLKLKKRIIVIILEKLLFTGKEAESYGQIGEVKKGWLRMVYNVFLGKKFDKNCLIIEKNL